MLNVTRLQHRFVQLVPESLEIGVLYVALEHRVATHLCCCGCGEEVVTTLSPTHWTLLFNGESVSLEPSVGNWALPCQSHYVVDRGDVIECGQWSAGEIAAEREKAQAERDAYFAGKASPRRQLGRWLRRWRRD